MLKYSTYNHNHGGDFFLTTFAFDFQVFRSFIFPTLLSEWLEQFFERASLHMYLQVFRPRLDDPCQRTFRTPQ